VERNAQPPIRRIALALAACGLVGTATLVASRVTAQDRVFDVYDPVLLEPGVACGPPAAGPRALLKNLVLAKTETAPFSAASAKASGAKEGAAPEVPLYKDLGTLTFKAGTKNPKAQAYFDQGLRLAVGFNHAEAQRSFQAAQRLDPGFALAYWGEALVLGPNINAPMMPEANAPALAALARASELLKDAPATSAPAKDRALIEALAKRYSADPKAERAALDTAFADAMKDVAARFPADDTIQVLYAESVMDTQPWDYWEAAGAKPKGRVLEIVGALETVLKRNPSHPGAIHLYIHAVEASTKPERALPHARRLAALMPGAGHIVHMPAHIYLRIGLYRESLEANKKAMRVDERYFTSSQSDPMYRFAYYPHNIHFVLVSAQMGGDAKTALDAAAKLDASLPPDVVKQFAVLEPIKGAPYFAHAQFSDPDDTLKLPAPASDFTLVKAMYHYARAVAFAAKKDTDAARREVDELAALEKHANFKPYADGAVPGKEIVQTARLVALGRIADARGDLDGAAKAYEDAIFIEDSLAYMEPPFWYYPVRQSLGSVRLRQGKLDEAEKAFRDSLGRVRNNGWALAGLAEVYRKKGDAKGEKAARLAYARAWFGGAAPELGRL
jgi:tetratricopeptide (TPR) repeat protein